MTEPSQYFKGRTVQEQMNEVIGYVDTRAAEVATTAIASDVAQVHQDMLDADADASAAAASAAAAAGTLANAVKKTGEASQSIAGDIAVAGNLTGGTVTVPTPVNNTDAATKKYVDDADALKISINNINNYAVGLTGNQSNINGIKKFVSSVNAILMNRTTDNNGDGTAGRYKVIMKLPLNVSYGPRQHILFGVTTRQRNRAFDLLTLYIAVSSPQNLDMVLRANTENYTYVLSYDESYAYVSILTTGGLGDSIQTLIIGGTENIINDFPFVTADETYDNPPGTELRRLTP